MTIMVVDDEKSIRLSLTMALKSLSVEVLSAENGMTAIQNVRNQTIDLVILDINLPDIDGIEVLRQIKQIDRACTVIMMTHLSEVKLAVEAMKLGAYDYYTKPFSIEEMLSSLKQMDAYLKDRQRLQSNAEAEAIIGESLAMEQIKTKIEKVTRVQFFTCVLITGESGTGKERVAKQIHRKFSADRPYIAINCAAIPKHLQESELFGHEQGAFSDAKHTRTGLFELAKDGILFLDEIGDMDLDLQAKLLRVLQERVFRRIGGNVEIPFNALVVAATNKNLLQEIERARFRKDLYYRLNIIPIEIPPLRERREDIPKLVQYFVRNYNDLLGKSVVSIPEEMMHLFERYNWPGNIRELKNIIERLMILSDSETLSLEELPYELINEEAISSRNELSHLEQAEQEVVLRALSKHQWNITKAAEALGISRLTLRRKIDKYGIDSRP
ncbi:sigma-54-dependent Fis family transcriptional regulator [Fusibacter paucivorans]|uniref:Stage 0 sporulation protein A homolog n=1 Tax=Fusibacter paucivorans TaxID=76009 RepID=A0ABS5PL46_9FIRM|nr:sigma-54 dependent transcriptional regulator [Fusibacter paucivorans]MBS7525884.1 sigma-54-dependent Fis family transcriptional regulator [Fusibacter paucivorans]